jgi:hypothetical protein
MKKLAVLRGNPAGDLFINFNSNNPNDVLLAIINLLLGIAGSVALLYLMIGGFMYITAGVNEDLSKRGKLYVRNSIIGLIIIVLSYTIVSVVYRELVR